jgi:hypothetical protein
MAVNENTHRLGMKRIAKTILSVRLTASKEAARQRD